MTLPFLFYYICKHHSFCKANQTLFLSAAFISPPSPSDPLSPAPFAEGSSLAMCINCPVKCT